MQKEEIPRRIQMDKLSPSEKAIYDAMQEVEKAGASTNLTRAVMFLERARGAVADHVDGVPPPEMGASPGPYGLLHLGRGTFGEATLAAKNGHKVGRAGWKGSGMFAYIVPANQYPAQTEAARATFGDMVPYREYWALKTAQNDVATWAPSGSDSLAEDWTIVE